MTTGTSVKDGRISTDWTGTGSEASGYSSTQFASPAWGPLHRKTWNGTDLSVSRVRAYGPSSPVGYSCQLPRPAPQYLKTYRRKSDGRVVTVYQKRPYTPLPKRPHAVPRTKRMKEVKPPHPYTVTFLDELWAPYYRTDSDGWRRVVNLQKTGSGTPQPPALDARQHYKLIEKLRRKAYGSGWNPGVFLAEMPQALRMISSSATRLRGAMLAAEKLNWRGIVRNLFGGPGGGNASSARRSFISARQGKIGVSQLWLELQYGWLPLVGDMQDGAAFIGYAVGGAGLQKPTRVSASRQWVQEWDWPVNNWEVSMSHCKSTFRARYVITNLWTADVMLPSLASCTQVAWEKLPWSFVVDWALPINSYLQALRTQADLHGTVVFTWSREDVYSHPRQGPFVRTIQPASSLTGEFRDFTLVRTVSTEIKPPSPLPDLSPGSVFSVWQRAVNAVALLTQLQLGNAKKLNAARKSIRYF